MVINTAIQLCDRLCGAMGAIICMQMPSFILHYQQRLGGHLAELRLHVAKLEAIADLSGKPLSEYIKKFIESSDGDFSLQGILMQQVISRAQMLQQSMEALDQASVWSRPFAFFHYIQWDIAEATFDAFVPTLPLSAEGLVYGCLGIVIGCLLFTFSLRLIGWLLGLLQPPKVPVPVPIPVRTHPS